MNRTNGRTNGLGNYRMLLLARKSALLSSLGTTPGALIAPGASAPEDLGPVFHDQSVALEINRLDALQLQQIDFALDRADEGDYGVCMDCDAPIPARRLEAIPWAARCVVCQERFNADRDLAPPDGVPKERLT